MKFKYVFFTTAMLLVSVVSFAQSVSGLVNQTQGQRSREMFENDDRKVTYGFAADFIANPNEKINGTAVFTTGIGAGLVVFVPVFASGDGSNIGNIDGDVTFSAGWKGWVPNDSNNPTWNTYSGMVGFRFAFGGLLFIEPQGGYTYGTYSNDNYKIPSSQVSGFTYDVHAGFSLVKGLDLYGIAQSIKTKQFNNSIDLGFGLDLHF